MHFFRIFFVLTIIIISGTAGCSGDSAQSLMDTAELELKQNNPEHARKLFQEIIQKYPETELAETAKAKLRQMGKTGG